MAYLFNLSSLCKLCTFKLGTMFPLWATDYWFRFLSILESALSQLLKHLKITVYQLWFILMNNISGIKISFTHHISFNCHNNPERNVFLFFLSTYKTKLLRFAQGHSSMLYSSLIKNRELQIKCVV